MTGDYANVSGNADGIQRHLLRGFSTQVENDDKRPEWQLQFDWFTFTSVSVSVK